MSENAMRVRVTGKVQGVGYRAYVGETAAPRHVRGWVKNAADGSVEAVLAGEALELEEVVGAMRQGPSSAEVEDVTTEPADLEEVRGCKGVQIAD
ncbi:acylphosphatase [Roseivivax sediminis]|uniref:acylphosphatase n=1 Tax=Roseivivax sediminis TaxID=936889 RepID=A0A1I1WLB6_9RHOB|nr:acylphosphatase [Roseivivax sediminis]SFD93880.1 acylphosphatase [Roseivivax sediminis]